MNRTDTQEKHPTGCSPEVCLSALSQRFASRGLAKSALLEAEKQIEAEAKTREMDPCAYRLSLLSDAAVNGVWRRGKDVMSGADLVRYARECRRMELCESACEETPSVYESAEATALETRIPVEGIAQKWQKKGRELLPTAVTFVKERFPKWFDLSAADTSYEQKKFPFSAFAAIAAIAVSMMLIVASALMVINTETKISQLNSDISALSEEITDLQSDLESGYDLMEIRRIAVEEYGMVEETYVRMDCVSLDSEERVEIFEDEEEKEIGLAAILSAMGWKK